MYLKIWPKIHAWAKNLNTCLGQKLKYMLGPKTKTHAWANAGNTCLAKCWKHMLGQMLEIYGLANLYLIKRGACPPLNYILLGQSIYFQHLAPACVFVFGPSMCFCFWPQHVFMFLAQACIKNHMY